MSRTELEERYRQLMSMPLTRLSQYNDEEKFGILFEDKSIRIFLIRLTNHDDIIRIEVELQASPNLDEVSDTDKISILERMISDLQYLKRLILHGFRLDIIENSCIWSLQKQFIGELDRSDLNLLQFTPYS